MLTLINVSFTPEKMIPLGPLYLISVLESEGFSVNFKDYQLTDDKSRSIDDFASFIEDTSDVIGISCMSSSLPIVLLGAKKLKEKYPDKTIILGGSGPTGVAKDILKNFPCIDIVVRGEAEITIINLMNNLNRDLSNVKGISYREGGKVIENPPQERIKNLDEISLPAYHKIKFNDYEAWNKIAFEKISKIKRINTVYSTYIITSRGCPYKCTFCSVAPLWGRRCYNRSIENVMEEVKLLYDEHKQRSIYISDDTFVIQKKRVIQFCDELKKEKMDLEWGCNGRINLMDKELMKIMAKNGCKSIFYGIESGSNTVLEKIKKEFTIEKALDVVSDSSKHFQVTTSFMWGFPFETKKDFFDSIIAMKQMWQSGANVQFHPLSPLPLSDICSEYNHNLILKENEISDIGGNWVLENDVIALIKEYPNMFSSYYYINEGDINYKISMAKKLGLLR